MRRALVGVPLCALHIGRSFPRSSTVHCDLFTRSVLHDCHTSSFLEAFNRENHPTALQDTLTQKPPGSIRGELMKPYISAYTYLTAARDSRLHVDGNDSPPDCSRSATYSKRMLSYPLPPPPRVPTKHDQARPRNAANNHNPFSLVSGQRREPLPK